MVALVLGTRQTSIKGGNKMKQKMGLLGAMTVIPLLGCAMAMPSRAPEVKLDGKLNCPFISTAGGTAYLHIILATDVTEKRDGPRRPMNISVVLDRSGSMADERKIDYAKSALNKLIDQLDGEDIFSLVVYDDVIDVLHTARRVGANKSLLKRLVREIHPRNSTNLGGGMVEGLRQAERNLGREYINRVILLSDGLANQGITRPVELNAIAKKYRNKSISLTTMGVGLDYNENLMVGLAESGGGNYYFIERPSQLASIMNKELNDVSTVVAQNAFIDLRLGRGVRVMDVIGCESVDEGDLYRIPLGDLLANNTRELTVELSIPPGTGTRTVVTGSLRCESARFSSRPSFTTTVRYTDDLVQVDKNRDLEVQAKADIAVSTRNVEKAMKALDEGREAEAKTQLRLAKELLVNSPAAASGGEGAGAIREQAGKLDSYQDALSDKDADVQRAKKAIQYENYRIQKKK
jgi:Ca-activated chloride channel family protein